MTVRKHFKKLVRARMAKTGESYAAARRQLLQQLEPGPNGPFHFTGCVPATTALRTILTSAGVRAPHTGQPFSEAMLFGIAGGIGIGVFSFVYESEGFSSFFVAGRHLWHDDLAYLTGAFARFEIAPNVREAGSAKAAQAALRQTVAEGPCVCWVDMAHLPHRGLPSKWSGGSYHLITVYRVSDDGTALVGDLTDEPITIPEQNLAAARGRIKKYRNRLLSISAATGKLDLAALVRGGLAACHRGLTGVGGVKSARANFSLEAVRRWAQRLHGDSSKDGWERAFPPGPRLWRGLASISQFVEYWGTGGGLCRPLFADFLREAADAVGNVKLGALAERYGELGRAWSDLADAALPTTVPQFKEARELYARIGEQTHEGHGADGVRAGWQRLDELEQQSGSQFPLSFTDSVDLLADLQQRVRALYEGESKAHAELGRLLD